MPCDPGEEDGLLLWKVAAVPGGVLSLLRLRKGAECRRCRTLAKRIPTAGLELFGYARRPAAPGRIATFSDLLPSQVVAGFGRCAQWPRGAAYGPAADASNEHWQPFSALTPALACRPPPR